MTVDIAALSSFISNEKRAISICKPIENDISSHMSKALLNTIIVMTLGVRGYSLMPI